MSANGGAACATQPPLSLVVVDVDYFKIYNDTYGHAAGDVVLKQVAKTIGAALRRPADFVARYGGEEFVVLLPEVDATHARNIAEAIRQAVVDQKISYPESANGPWLTVSLGGATRIPRQYDVDAALFDHADHYLYQAKGNGRNRVMWQPADSVG